MALVARLHQKKKKKKDMVPHPGLVIMKVDQQTPELWASRNVLKSDRGVEEHDQAKHVFPSFKARDLQQVQDGSHNLLCK